MLYNKAVLGRIIMKLRIPLVVNWDFKTYLKLLPRYSIAQLSLAVLKCNEDKWDPRHLLGLNKEIPLNLEHMVSKCLAQAPKPISPHHYLFLMSAFKLVFRLVQFWYVVKIKGLFFQGNNCIWCILSDAVHWEHSNITQCEESTELTVEYLTLFMSSWYTEQDYGTSLPHL